MKNELTNDDILRLAQTFGTKLTGDAHADWLLIQQHIRTCDVVYAVWDEAFGCKSRAIIKGNSVFQRVAKTGVSKQLLIGAIPCSSAAQAEAFLNYVEQNEPSPMPADGTHVH